MVPRRTASWRKRVGLPLLAVFLGYRIYTRLQETTNEILKKGEWPRDGDVLVVGIRGVSTLLVRALEAAVGARVPDLDTGSARSSFVTGKFAALPPGFWRQDDAKKRRLLLARNEDDDETRDHDALRLFTSSQALNESLALGVSDVRESGIEEDPCPSSSSAYACLCPNCPARWRNLVYVVSNATWNTAHVSSYLDGNGHDVALLARPGFADEALLRIHRPRTLSPKRRVLVVKAEDVRRKPGHAAAAVVAWILDTLEHKDQLDDAPGLAARVDRALAGLTAASESDAQSEPATEEVRHHALRLRRQLGYVPWGSSSASEDQHSDGEL